VKSRHFQLELRQRRYLASFFKETANITFGSVVVAGLIEGKLATTYGLLGVVAYLVFLVFGIYLNRE